MYFPTNNCRISGKYGGIAYRMKAYWLHLDKIYIAQTSNIHSNKNSYIRIPPLAYQREIGIYEAYLRPQKEMFFMTHISVTKPIHVPLYDISIMCHRSESIFDAH